MNLHNVLVVMATHNGEKYLKRCLDSIAGQENVLVSLLISDDNSSDTTLEIAREYSTVFQNVEIVSGPNEGPSSNFMQALSLEFTEQFDFIALADQDDIWLRNHLFDSISMIGSTENAVLVHSPTILIDMEDKQLDYQKKRIGNMDFRFHLVANYTQGCTLVMNSMARRLVIKYNPKDILMHDWWISLVIRSTGVVLQKAEPSVLYRIHDGNLLGYPYLRTRVFKYVKTLLFGHFRALGQLKSLVEFHGNRIDAQKLREIETLVQFQSEHFFLRIKRALLLRRHRLTLIEEIGFLTLLIFKTR